MTDKLIASIEAESAVIGALIIDNDKFDEIATLLRSDDFYVSAHKVLFEGVSHLLTQGKPADILTLEQYFKDKKLIDQIGGLAYLADIIHNTPSASNITAYAEIISRYSKQRRFLTLGQFIVTEMQSSKDEIELTSFEESVDKQYTNIVIEQETDGVADLNASFERILSRMETSSINADPVSGTPTGIIELDRATTGGQPGELIIIAARPAMGKTTFAQTIAASTLNFLTALSNFTVKKCQLINY